MAKLDRETARKNGWPETLDKLLVGVTHHISNRVATLAGVSDILAGDLSVPPILRSLADEVPKLEESIRLLRLLAVPENEAEEALEAHRLVNDAVALARLHPDTTDVDYIVQDGRAAPPVLAHPIALTHRIVIALTVAAADAVAMHGNACAVTVSYSVVEPELVIQADAYAVPVQLLSAARAARS